MSSNKNNNNGNSDNSNIDYFAKLQENIEKFFSKIEGTLPKQMAKLPPLDFGQMEKIIKVSMQEEGVPIFKFALRSDLEGDQRFIPKRATKYDSGYDVSAAMYDKKDLILRAGQFFKIPLGIRGYLPENYYYQLYPRSSSFTKKKMNCLIGIIDQEYSGELCFAGQYLPDVSGICQDLTVSYGEKIGQIIPFKRQEIIIESISNEEIDKLYSDRKSERTAEGFGSTNLK